ncbi:MAG TPA: 2-phospho-L-lactate guanylyltransferase [Acidimicrobiales bacterium]|nr:2-phospho-L-lactate guanylyltransferase [Acidimicrobiales bacterium]
MRSAVVIPVKSFALAKGRLAAHLSERQRRALARQMAETVVRAAGALPVVVACDDDAVAAWARDVGARVAWVPGTDLNGAVGAAVASLADVDRVVVAHADLPKARDLSVVVGTEGVVLVPDRRGDGTNVLSVPSTSSFPFAYGPGSFARHASIAHSMGLPVTVLRPDDLTWDVDEPADLEGVHVPCA